MARTNRMPLGPLFVSILLTTSVVVYVLWVSSGRPENTAIVFGPFRYGIAPWRTNTTLAARTLVESPFMKLEVHSVKTPTGKIVNDWLWFDIADQVNILVEVNGQYAVFRQMKYGLVSESFAVVGGLMEKGETPSEAAARELNEEMGLEATDLVFLGKFRTDVNRGGGFVHSFLAAGCHPSRTTVSSDDMEKQVRVLVSRAELLTMVLSNQFQEVKWSNTIALALLR